MALEILPAGIASTLKFGVTHISRGTVIAIFIDGIDMTEKVLWAGGNITDSLGNIKGLTLTVDEAAGADIGLDLIILDKRTSKRIFGGLIKEVTKKFYKKDYYEDNLLVQDYTRLIDDVQDGVTEEYTTKTEKYILTDLFSTYCSSITVGSDVITGSSVSISFTNSNLRSAIDNLAAVNDRKWYVDYNKQLHYYNIGDEVAPFELSDDPDYATTFPYFELEYTKDAVGSELRGLLKCWEPGLFAGMMLGITNNKLTWSSEDFLIYEVSTKFVGGDIYSDLKAEYNVAFGSPPKRITSTISDPSTGLVPMLEWYDRLKDYVFINEDGDLCLRAEYLRHIKCLSDLGMMSVFTFGLFWAAIADKVKFYTKGGTLDHAFCPDNNGHGLVGHPDFWWLAAYIKEIHVEKLYVSDELYIPSEAA